MVRSALLRGMIASVLVAVTVYAVTLRFLPSLSERDDQRKH
jgi:hypothetical protein